jgi:methionyl-tRNA formyltransferase
MVRYAFLVLEEHPYGREMLAQLLDGGFEPAIVIEERSQIAEVEREKFLVRIRGHAPAPTFTELLQNRSVRRVAVPSCNGDECASLLKSVAPELILLGGTGILKKHIFEIAPTLNSHPGLLPEVRGSASVAWAVHLDLPIGCTCHFIEAGIDTGPIVGRRVLDVHRGDTYEDLCHRTLRLSGTLMREALQAHVQGNLHSIPQGPGAPAHKNMPEEMVEQVKAKLARGEYAHYSD